MVVVVEYMQMMVSSFEITRMIFLKSPLFNFPRLFNFSEADDDSRLMAVLASGSDKEGISSGNQ